MNGRMSAIGPKRTYACALQESAFGGEADMTFRGNPLLRSLFGVKRTCLFEQMSAVDPKRTSSPTLNDLFLSLHRAFPSAGLSRYDAMPEPRGRQ
jgi:hypothetical protein